MDKGSFGFVMFFYIYFSYVLLQLFGLPLALDHEGDLC